MNNFIARIAGAGAAILGIALVLIPMAPAVHAQTVTLGPTSVGFFDQWELIAGDDKVSAVQSDDGNNSYIATSTLGSRQTFVFDTANLPANTVIDSITLTSSARRAKTNGTDVKLVAERGGEVSASEAFGLTLGYGTHDWILTENPFTNAPWTADEVTTWLSNGQHISFGIEHAEVEEWEARLSQLTLVIDYHIEEAQPDPSPTPTLVPEPTHTPTPTPTTTPSVTQTPATTPTPTAEPSTEPKPTPSQLPGPTPTLFKSPSPSPSQHTLPTPSPTTPPDAMGGGGDPESTVTITWLPPLSVHGYEAKEGSAIPIIVTAHDETNTFIPNLHLVLKVNGELATAHKRAGSAFLEQNGRYTFNLKVPTTESAELHLMIIQDDSVLAEKTIPLHKTKSLIAVLLGVIGSTLFA